MAEIEFRDIHKSFGEGDARVEALKGVSDVIHSGEMVAIMGKSGSGKSTLLNIMGGLMTMDSGSLLYDGEELDFKNKKKLYASINRTYYIRLYSIFFYIFYKIRYCIHQCIFPWNLCYYNIVTASIIR